MSKRNFLVLLLILALANVPAIFSQHPVDPATPTPATPNSGSHQNHLSSDSAPGKTGTSEESLTDHKAMIFNASGDIKILKKGSAEWRAIEANETIGEGDQMKTEADAFVELVYDDFYLNLARIGSNTLVEFRAIEPTDIFLSNGGVFNDLDGLAKGTTYEVATPTSVAGVRGTEFYRAFDASSKTDTVFVKEGEVAYMPLDLSGNIIDKVTEVGAGMAIEMPEEMHQQMIRGEIPNIEARPMTPEQNQQIREMFSEVKGDLVAFAGDPNLLGDMKEKFEAVRNDPEKMAAFRERIEEKDREMGIGNPNDKGPSGDPQNPAERPNNQPPSNRTGNDPINGEPGKDGLASGPAGEKNEKVFERDKIIEPNQQGEGPAPRDFRGWERDMAPPMGQMPERKIPLPNIGNDAGHHPPPNRCIENPDECRPPLPPPPPCPNPPCEPK